MPAPKVLAGLPKPLLFGLYGAVGGLLGALFFGELLWFLLRPPKPPAPEPELALAVTDELQIYQGGTNKLFVRVARGGFDEDVLVRVAEGLPAGVTATEATIAAGQTEGEIALRAGTTTAVSFAKLKVAASARPRGSDGSVTASADVKLSTLGAQTAEADIVFVLDVTGSMQQQINGLRDGIGRFATELERAKINARFGCVCFRDFTDPAADRLQRMEVLRFGGEEFTAAPRDFSSEVARQVANGGGDWSESSFEALSTAAKYKDWRKSATRVLILITDAPPKLDPQGIEANGKGQSLEDTKRDLAANKIDLLHLVIGTDHPDLRDKDPTLNDRMRDWYTKVQEGVLGVAIKEKGGAIDRGKLFDLPTVARTPSQITDTLLPEMSTAIATAAESKRPDANPTVGARPDEAKLKSLQSNEQIAAGSETKLVVRSGVWTGAIAALVCLFLLAGQHHYLRGTLPAAGGIAAAVGGGLLVGLVGGAAGQGLFLVVNIDNKVVDAIFRVMGWTILGSMAGAGLSLFIPNLKPVYGLAGGAVGGAVGAIGFIAVTGVLRAISLPETLADVLGRLTGGLILGLFIGLMIAVVEAAFRRAWLEVQYGPREMVTVNLGAEPVKVGSDARACTVWARGAAEVELRYFLRDGQVICTDVPSRSEEVVRDGDTREAGNVTVVVRTGTSATPDEPDRGRRSAPPPPPKPKPRKAERAPEPMSLDEFEDDGLPMPAQPTSRPKPDPLPLPPPPPARPASAPPPRPVAPPASATRTVPAPPAARPPSSAPTIKPTTRDPDACPGCGRKIAGKPGARYCMVCDQTF